MRVERVTIGRERTAADGCRRYRPVEFTFDTRSLMVATEIEEHWDPAVQEQWRNNQAGVRAELLADLGNNDGDAKIANVVAMGSAPWSVIAAHNHLLAQIRSAFAHGDFY